MIGSLRFRHLVYTGAIDEYYDFSEGALGYRSLRFEHEPVDQEYFQPGMQVNYPNDHAFTRIIEIKHATGQQCPPRANDRRGLRPNLDEPPLLPARPRSNG